MSDGRGNPPPPPPHQADPHRLARPSTQGTNSSQGASVLMPTSVISTSTAGVSASDASAPTRQLAHLAVSGHDHSSGARRPREDSGRPVHNTLGVPLPPLDPPKLLPVPYTMEDKYEVLQALGEGTYGEVYLGYEKSRPNRHLALKRLKVLQQLEGFPLTSIREVFILRFLQDPRISAEDQRHFTHLREIVVSRNFRDTYLVFEYVDHSLMGLARRGLRFNAAEMAFLFHQIVRALEVLHGLRVVHRDIKASNVLIDNNAEVKLCDFGLSFATTNDRARMTPSLVALEYRPPEMLLGHSQYTEAIDTWSVGCLLAQMYLHTPPFMSPNPKLSTELTQLRNIVKVLGPFPKEMLKRVKNAEVHNLHDEVAEPIPFREWFLNKAGNNRHNVPDAAVDLIQQMLTKDPAQRPSMATLRNHPFFTANRLGFHAAQLRLQQELRQLPPSHDAVLKREQQQGKRRRVQQQQQQQPPPGSMASAY